VVGKLSGTARNVTGLVAIFTLICSMDVVAQDNSAYVQFGCSACHGSDGEGSRLGPGIAPGALTLAEFIDYVRQPTGTMPAYDEQTVSSERLNDMYSYFERMPASPESPGSRDIERGAGLYARTGCYQCHANEGQGGAQGPRLGPDPLTLARFTWYVRNPSGGMPPYTDVVMSDQDLADIHAFLTARPQPPAVDSILLLKP
jgi:mono/diheme cytochrome c family protein